MPRQPSQRSLDVARSLLQKSLNHEFTRKRQNKPPPLRQTSAEDLRPIATQDGLRLLRQISRRIDKDLKRRKDQVSALLAVIHFRKAGVLWEHLPVLPSARQLVQIVDARRITSKAHARLVLDVLQNNELATLLGAHSEALASAHDTWHQARDPRRVRTDA